MSKILMWDTTAIKNPPGVMMLFLTAYMLMSFIIISIYMGILISFMTKEPFKWKPIESLDELKVPTLKWLG